MAAGRLTTHVLDTALGQPASDLKIELFRLVGDDRQWITAVQTNDDGRTDAPMLSGEAFQLGVYELVFHAGDYLSRQDGVGSTLRFLDQIPIRFGIADADQHFHVPLLLSPFSYSTYRGS